jgi:D-alanyl-D-alanine-carboxypeptidase/D-alanyl-D-alanine-endopeptidase
MINMRKLALAVLLPIFSGALLSVQGTCAAATVHRQPIEPKSPAQIHVPVDSNIEKAARQMFNRYRCPLAVGIIDERGSRVYGFGKDSRGHAVSGNSQFETASVSKVFTGLLLAESIERKEVRLNQPISEVLKCGIPQFDGGPMTFKQLATHMSGLPDWPSNRGSTTSPYSSTAMKYYLRTAQRADFPGDMTYSNTGFALLGMALAERSHQSFEELLISRVCTPLGMKNTSISLNKDMKTRLVCGHNASGGLMLPSCPTAGGGADGVRSTPNDLLRFVGAYAGLVPNSIGPSLRLSYALHETINDQDDMGLGWYLRKPTGIIWKGGNIAGYRSYVAFQPQQHVGVVVLSGSNGFPAHEFGEYVLLQLLKSNSN